MTQCSNQAELLTLHMFLFYFVCFSFTFIKEMEPGLKAHISVLDISKNPYFLSSTLHVITALGQLNLLKA